MVGIYTCPAGATISPQAKCSKLTSIAAPSEWVLSTCWLLYMLVVGYDLYHAEDVRQDLIWCTTQTAHSEKPAASDTKSDVVYCTRPASPFQDEESIEDDRRILQQVHDFVPEYYQAEHVRMQRGQEEQHTALDDHSDGDAMSVSISVSSEDTLN